MGRAASHITLECALQTHPNISLIGEEVSTLPLDIYFILYLFFLIFTQCLFASLDMTLIVCGEHYMMSVLMQGFIHVPFKQLTFVWLMTNYLPSYITSVDIFSTDGLNNV
jgi:hypothetical protein